VVVWRVIKERSRLNNANSDVVLSNKVLKKSTGLFSLLLLERVEDPIVFSPLFNLQSKLPDRAIVQQRYKKQMRPDR